MSASLQQALRLPELAEDAPDMIYNYIYIYIYVYIYIYTNTRHIYIYIYIYIYCFLFTCLFCLFVTVFPSRCERTAGLTRGLKTRSQKPPQFCYRYLLLICVYPALLPCSTPSEIDLGPCLAAS